LRKTDPGPHFDWPRFKRDLTVNAATDGQSWDLNLLIYSISD
jgi:N-acetyl-anhydromuramyl-L-alanine amidase AmpD